MITSPFLNSGISCANTRFRFTKLTHIHKKSIPGNKNTSDPSSRKTKILSKEPEKINQRLKHIGHYTRISDTLQKKTFPKIKNSEGDRHIQGSEDSGKPGNFRYVEKRCDKGMSTSPKTVCEHPVFSSKKNGGNRPVINFKKLDKLIPYQHLKMNGLHYLRYMLQQGDYMCKLDMKNAYFSVPLRRNSRDKVRFQWSGTLY